VDNWRTDDTYVNGHRRNVQVLQVFKEFVEWQVHTKHDGLLPLAFQEQMLAAGTWTTADIDYGGFVYVPASLFPLDHVVPAFSMAPYLTTPHVKAFISCLHQTGYAFTTIREIYYPVVKKFVKGLTGKDPSLELVAALNQCLRELARDPLHGRKLDNACGKAPCLVDDLAHIITSMPITLQYYHEECYAFQLGLSIGARSISVYSMKNEDAVVQVVPCAERVSKTTGKPLLIVSSK
jgi:hypothetical protein